MAKELKAFRGRRKRDKRKAFALQLGVVILAAVSTIALGFHTTNSTTSTILANVALICSASVTVLAATEAFFSHRELWVLRTRTVRELEALDRRIRFLEHDPAALHDVEAAARDMARLNSILDDDREGWAKIRNAELSTTKENSAGTQSTDRSHE